MKSLAIADTVARNVHGMTIRYNASDIASVYRKGRNIGCLYFTRDSGTGEMVPTSYHGSELWLLRDDIIESMLQLGLATAA